jgi:hypothetical protein
MTVNILQNHLGRMVRQMVDSAVPTTREYWRLKVGANEQEASDPRPFADVLAERGQ